MQQAEIETERLHPVSPDEEDESPEVAAQVAEIEQTRSEMASTIDAIRDKLDPATLAQQAKDSIREATIGRAQEAVGNAVDTAKEAVGGAVDTAKEAVSNAVDTAKDAMSGAMDTAREAMHRPARAVRETSSSLMDTIRENPVPAAMIGIGLGWLMMSAQRNSERSRWRESGYDPDYDYRSDSGTPEGYYSGRYDSRGGGYYYGDADQHQERSGRISQAKERVGEAVSTAKDRVGEAVGQARDKASELTQNVQRRASELTDGVRERAGDLGEQTRYRTRQAVTGLQHTMEENPVALGAVALAVGAAIGILLPETQAENRWMGDARDQIVDRVQSTGQDIAQKAKSVASEAFQEAKSTVVEEARNQGLNLGGSSEGQPTGSQDAQPETPVSQAPTWNKLPASG
jgi:ElaB/YqjD/DUF883 family membrane-anchored ribosome-binding protein